LTLPAGMPAYLRLTKQDRSLNQYSQADILVAAAVWLPGQKREEATAQRLGG
jgi:hypothetical protein